MGLDIHTSKSFERFCQQFRISPITGIPYSPQGQGMVESAHLTIKSYLQKTKKGALLPWTPKNHLNHVLFYFKFLKLG